jgi:hypothetical protein
MPLLPRNVNEPNMSWLSMSSKPVVVSSAATIPPPLCRWSSAPPSDQMINSSSYRSTCSPDEMTRRRRSLVAPPIKPHRSMMRSSMPPISQSFKSACDGALPPRLPKRKSGKAEELLSALPPRVPQRKPGDAIMEANALPPFMPRRFPHMDDSCDNMSLVSSLTMSSGAAAIDELSDDGSQDSSTQDILNIRFGTKILVAGSTSSSDRSDYIRRNLRVVLGKVLDQLDDSLDEDF